MKKTIIFGMLIALSSSMFIGCSTLGLVSSTDDTMGSAQENSEYVEESFQEPAVFEERQPQKQFLAQNKSLRVSVVGQGVSPMNTTSPAQAYALAKRAAIADAYRLVAEKVKGVHVEGQDLIENMMIKRSTVRTTVNAMIKNAYVVETSFKEGLCEVEMEVVLSHAQFTL